ncbi:MAG: 16S rRNA (uracil(1498)-N(3))-methyltransferase [Deltaproteobacteria bacterium]|nr:16S rRNA (uracil(1498)-N(3))-methyltransferase [Deltaproteobacteria bacterium]
MTILRLRLESPAPADGRLEVSGPEHRYLSRVRRVRAGEPVELFDGAGRRWRGIVERIGPASAVLSGLAEQAPVVTVPLVLAVGLGRGEPLARVVRAAAELAVDRVVPLLCARSLARGSAGGAVVGRLRRVAAEALRAGGAGRAPQIDEPVSLDAWCTELPPDAAKLVLDLGGEPLREAVAARRDPPPVAWVLVVGPEGGFAPEELERLAEAGFVRVALTDLPLRVETAAVGAVAALRALVG